MNILGLFRRTKSETTSSKGNRTLTQAEMLARVAQNEAKERSEAKRQTSNNPNRLRTSDEFREEQREKRKRRRKENQIGGLIREVLSGDILAREALVKQVPFLLYLSLLTLLYLGMGYQTERVLREKQRTLDLLEEATAEEKTLRSDFEAQLQQSSLAKSTSALGLEQPTSPPILLPVNP